MVMQQSGAFGPRTFHDFAVHYAEHGLTVFPVGGDDGKHPLVKNWRKFKPGTHERLLDRFASDNIGILNDSGLTVIDVDDPKLAYDVPQRFGDTPIKIGTPSGGYHFWYRSNGEARRTRLDGQKIDVLGKGGFAVAPPSLKPDGGGYHFIEGSSLDIPNLPPIKQGALPGPATKSGGDTGIRNDRLFNFCLKVAHRVAKEDDLTMIALEENARFDPPMEANEVHGVVKSVWDYQTKGKNLTGRWAAIIDDAIFQQLAGEPTAFMLMAILMKNHHGLRGVFCIDQEKVGQIMGGCNRKTVRRAINILMEKRLIQKHGMNGRALLYRFII